MSACQNLSGGMPCHGLFAHADTDGESILRPAARGRGFHLRHYGIACEAGLPGCTRVRPRTRRMELKKIPFHARGDAGGYIRGDAGGFVCEGAFGGMARWGCWILHGIFVPLGKTLTIKGGGSLTARSNGLGAGIGGQCERTRRGRRGLRHGDLQEARVCLTGDSQVGRTSRLRPPTSLRRPATRRCRFRTDSSLARRLTSPLRSCAG